MTPPSLTGLRFQQIEYHLQVHIIIRCANLRNREPIGHLPLVRGGKDTGIKDSSTTNIQVPSANHALSCEQPVTVIRATRDEQMHQLSS